MDLLKSFVLFVRVEMSRFDAAAMMFVWVVQFEYTQGMRMLDVSFCNHSETRECLREIFTLSS